MSTILLIVGWILFLIVTGFATLFGAGLHGGKGSEHPIVSGWHHLLIWAAAIVSKILWIKSIWLAIGIWLVIGVGLGYVTERIVDLIHN